MEKLYDWVVEIAIPTNESPFNLLTKNIEDIQIVQKSLIKLAEDNRLPSICLLQINALMKAWLGVKK